MKKVGQLSDLIDVVALSEKLCKQPMFVELVYATRRNFVGTVIDGYTKDVTDLALLTREAAEALCAVQNDLLKNHDLGLLVYDSYRPKRAVMHFVRWSGEPVADDEDGKFELTRKEKHYPHIEKSRMFELGYVSKDSQHCYGHTVDLVLVDRDGNELDHGARFDFMDPLSHLVASVDDIGATAIRNRKILSDTMQKYGFVPYEFEYWHFSFKDKTIHEPMDFEITEEMKGLNVE
jgi:D-alanyl-D-alanine dipeptidase